MIEPISAGLLRGQTNEDPLPSSSLLWPANRLARNDPNQSTKVSSIWPSSRLAQNSDGNQSNEEESNESLLGKTLSNFLSYPTPTPEPTKQEYSELPSICLENPDDPVCDKLHQAYYHAEYYTRGKKNFPKEETAPSPSPRTANVPTVRYYPLATSSPTRDMCYGNMAKHMYGKFCHSEMPSVSAEPSEQPTYFPADSDGEDAHPASTPSPSESPSASPTLAPSIRPSESPSARPSIDIMDDDVDHFDGPDSEDMGPTPSPTQSPTLSWRQFPTHRPSSFSFDESEDSGRPNDDNGEYIKPPKDSNAVRLKLYWQPGYYWQEETFERKWCMRCENNLDCQVGEKPFLGDCAEDWYKTAYFNLISYGDHEFVQIQVISADEKKRTDRQRRKRNGFSSSDLCLERSRGRHVTLEQCHTDGKEEQLWRAPQGSFRNIQRSNNRFELSQSLFGGMDYCLTNHHHPKYGETLEMYTCDEARRDQTSFWNTY